MKKKFQIFILSWLLHVFLWFILKTCKIKVINEDVFNDAVKSPNPVFICCWHRYFIYAAHYFNITKKSIWAVSSTHRDSEILAHILVRWGFQLIRGSSRRGWRHVLTRMMALYKDKNTIIAITNDGPTGPPFVAKKGSASLAHKAGAQMIAISGVSSGFWSLKSWDKTQIPKPFSTIYLRFSKPFVKFENPDNESEEISNYINKNHKRLMELQL